MNARPDFLRHYAPAVAATVWSVVAVTGSLANTRSNLSWYETQKTPSWRPPNWLFAPTWTTLYALLAISTTRVLRLSSSPQRQRALNVYAANAVLNGLWSWLFFAWKLKGPAAFELSLVLMTAVLMLASAARLDQGAALLVAPYVGWVSFASALMFSIWWRNR